MAKIGITTTIPVEIIYASGHIPVDLNNIFITSSYPGRVIDSAEFRGFPRTLCSWVKGIYGILQKETDIETIIAVIEGDCSNTLALAEILRAEGRKILTFSYPYNKDKDYLKHEMENVMKQLGTNWADVLKWKKRLDSIRNKVAQIDLLTWTEGTVSGAENHIFLISTSDFNGDPDRYESAVDEFINKLKYRHSLNKSITKLGLVGVPPIFGNFFEFIERNNAAILFNEVVRQFSMPDLKDDILDQYVAYTYPYGIEGRIKDIEDEIKKRRICGLIHYSQTFCHHQIEHILLKEKIDIPILFLEGDRPGNIDERTKIRIESFLEMLR